MFSNKYLRKNIYYIKTINFLHNNKKIVLNYLNSKNYLLLPSFQI